MNCASNGGHVLLNTYKHRHSETISMFGIFVSMLVLGLFIMSKSMSFIFNLLYNSHIKHSYNLIGTGTLCFFCTFFRIYSMFLDDNMEKESE